MFITAILLILSAMMPYLPASLRVEHILMPLLAIWAVMRASHVHQVTIWAVGSLMIAVGITAYFSLGSYQTGADADPLTMFVRLMLPAVAMMGLPHMLAGKPRADLDAAKAMVLAGAIAAAFTMASLVWPAAKDVLALWVRSETGSVWMNAQDIGRYTGIFNQPIEAGIFYSLALISCVHVLRHKGLKIGIVLFCAVFIVIGGSLSLSKNFIVLGALIALLYAFTIRMISRFVAIILSIPIAVAIPIAVERFNTQYFTSLIDIYQKDGLLSALSAGRFSAGRGTVSDLFSDLFMSGDWVTGHGLGSHLPLDNGFLEYFYQGGIVALVGYVTALLALTLFGWANRSRRAGIFLLALLAYTWLASLGGPVLTASRANICLLVLVAACMANIRTASAQQRALQPPLQPKAAIA